jgi:hypothetical protein
MQQPRISALEDQNYENFEAKTLRRIASAFDVGLSIRFVPLSEIVDWASNIDDQKLVPKKFDEDDLPAWKPDPQATQFLIPLSYPVFPTDATVTLNSRREATLTIGGGFISTGTSLSLGIFGTEVSPALPLTECIGTAATLFNLQSTTLSAASDIINEKNREIARKDQEIAELRAELAAWRQFQMQEFVPVGAIANQNIAPQYRLGWRN